MIILDNKSSSNSTKNTGKANQDLFDATINYVLTKDNFGFDNVEDARSKEKWDEAKKNKDIVVMFSVEGSELANAEATFYESRTLKKETKAARKGIKLKHHLDMFSHSAVKSYQNSGYTRIIEFTEDGKIKFEENNGKIVGQKMSEFIVGLFQEPVIAGDPGSTSVEVIYEDYNSFEDNAHVLIPQFDLESYEGIYDILLNVKSKSATEIVVEAMTLDGNKVTNLVMEDLQVLDVNGDIQNITVGSYSEVQEAYVLSGTAFETGTLSTKGVIVQTNIMYEAAPVKIEI